jgi:hypothetical protein
MRATSRKCSNQDFGASPCRSDYAGDTAASLANSLVFSVKVVVTDARLLMICHNQRRQLGRSGPRHQPNEPLLGTAVRETLEETDITCQVAGLLGIYTDRSRSASHEPLRPGLGFRHTPVEVNRAVVSAPDRRHTLYGEEWTFQACRSKGAES